MKGIGTMHRAVFFRVLFVFLFLAPAVPALHARAAVSTELRDIPSGLVLAQWGGSGGRGRAQEDSRTRERYNQWQNLSPAEKEMYRQRMDQYRQMSPQDRQRYQQRYQQWQDLSPDEQEQVHRKMDRWPSLPPDEKQRIRNRFAP
jgi:hypothetical protein